MLLERAKQRLAQYTAGTLPAKVAADWTPGQNLGAGLRYSEAANCPACGGSGTIEGDEAVDVEVRYEQVSSDDFDVLVDVSASSDYFSCSNCGLVLDNYQLVEQAGLDTVFDAEGSSDDIADYEGDYGND
jgi:hypothetical protein